MTKRSCLYLLYTLVIFFFNFFIFQLYSYQKEMSDPDTSLRAEEEKVE